MPLSNSDWREINAAAACICVHNGHKGRLLCIKFHQSFLRSIRSSFFFFSGHKSTMDDDDTIYEMVRTIQVKHALYLKKND